MYIELRQLRYFVTVAEEMHFGRAAIKLHMTQPPLSQAIQALEAQLGTALFTRTTRHIALTVAGIALLPEAKKLLAQTQALAPLAQRAAAGEIGQLTLAFVSIADYSVLPSTLLQFRQQQPEVKIALREATSDIQLQLLEQSEIDVGLLIPPIPDQLNNTLSYRKLLSEPLIIALPEAFARRSRPTELRTYKDLPLLLFPRIVAPALHDTILRCFHEQGLTPVIGQEAIQMQTIIALVSAGMGMALVPQSVSNLQRKGVVYKTLSSTSVDKYAHVEIGIAWRQDNTSPVLHAFLNLFPH